jgi:hypothetical protein
MEKDSRNEDPLAAKRPLYWSCLSCDIDVDKVFHLTLAQWGQSR